MKSTTKILSVLLAALMIVGMFAGCSGKEKDPAELFVNALDMYHDAVSENKVVKLIEDATTNGSMAIKVETGEDDEKTKFDVTAYMNAAGNAASLVLDAEIEGQKIDAQMLMDQKKVVIGTTLLKDAYGIDLEKAKDNFSSSLFGTAGANMLDLDEESEKEIIAALDELATALKQEAKTVDVYQLFIDAFKANAKFTADTKTPVTIDGKEVKNTTVTATVTKSNVKSIVNKLITDLEMQDLVDEMLNTMNAAAEEEAEWSGEPAVTYENMNAVIDEAFEGKGDDDTVLTVKMVLDTKHDAIMVLELTADETVKIELGADPKNVTKVVIHYPTEEMPVDSTEPITKTEKVTIDINKSNTSTEYKMLNETEDGFVIAINKAHQEVTLAEIIEGEVQSDEAFSFTYQLTDNQFSVTSPIEDSNRDSIGVVSITFTAQAESPVKYDDYKDLLKLTEEDFANLMMELAPLMGEDIPVEPDMDFDVTLEDGITLEENI